MVSIKFPSTQRSGSFVHSSSTPVVVAHNETLALNIPLWTRRTYIICIVYSANSSIRLSVLDTFLV